MFNLLTRKSPVTRKIEPSLRATFTPNEIASMAGLGSMATIEAGADLLVEGTPGTHVYFITEGTAAIRRGDTVVAVVRAGDMVGERALILDEPRSATVTALEPLQVLRFDRRQFQWLRLESAKIRCLAEALIESRKPE